MSANFSMLNGIFSFIEDFLTGIFAFIPQMMYFVYTCAASILDFCQWVVRKLAGLDVYYVNGVAQDGDIILSVLKGILGIETDTSGAYSTLSTVFWSMVIFGVVILVLSTILKLIMTHYNYNPEESKPTTIIRGTIKTLFTMALIPIVTIFGIEISNALLKTLDQISSGSSAVVMDSVYGTSATDYASFFKAGEDNNGYATYSSYDVLSFGSYTNMTSISGELFKVAVNDANRVRKGSYTPHENGQGDGWSNLGIFSSTSSDEDTRREEVAYMIDFAFANNLKTQTGHIASVKGWESLSLISSYSFLQSAVWYGGTINFHSFSKYNVGLVWYYYNLWHFNYFIAVAGFAVALSLIFSIMFGLMSRLINVLALFLVYPTLLGVAPLKNDVTGSWKGEFVGNILMCFGTIVGMNLCFMILPLLQNISFFNSKIPDVLFNMIIMISALISVKEVIKIFSQITGSKDAVAEGEGVKKEMQEVANKAADKVVKVAKVAAVIYSGGAALAVEAAKAAAKKKAKQEIMKKIQEKIKKKQKENIKKDLKGTKKDEKGTSENSGPDYNKMAREKLEQERPDLFEDGKREGTKRIRADKRKEYQKLMAETKSDLEKKDHVENKADDFASKKADDALKFRDAMKKAFSARKIEMDTSELGGEGANAQKQYAWLLKKINDDLAAYQKEKEKSGSGELFDDEIKRKEEEFFNERLDTAMRRYLEDSQEVDDFAEEYRKDKKADKQAKRSEKKKAKPQGFVKRIASEYIDGALEIPAKSIKVIGSLSGITAFTGTLKKNGTTDGMQDVVRTFAQAHNIKLDGMGKSKQEKDKEEKAKKQAQAENLGKIYSYSDATAEKVSQLTTLIKDLDKNYKPKTNKKNN